MRTLAKNKVPMKYALYEGQTPIYQLDENGEPVVSYIDNDGNIYYVEIGSEPKYSEPTEFFASISMSGGESVSVEFGVDIGNYDAVIVTELNEFPISETSYVWVSSEPQHSPQGLVDVTTADFRVTAVKPSLNQTKYLLRAITK